MHSLIKKFSTILAAQVLLVSFCFAGLALPSSASAAKPEIPAGCPGSDRAGPPAPGTCDKIPAGCPGSSKQGPPKKESECPYARPDKNGSKKTSANVLKYCKNKISGKAQAACTNKNVDRILDVVNNEKAAKNVIDKIDNQNPKSVKDFNDILDRVLNDLKTGVSQGGQPPHCSGSNCDLVALYVNPFIRLLSLIVGLIVAASLILGGIQYSASGGDPQKASAAKSRIQNTLLALLAFAFLYAFLNFLIPGGLFT